MAKAKAEAAEKGVSMNQVLLEAIGRGLGVDKAPKINGLEKFAGSMPFESEEERKQWENFLDVDLNQIDKEDWE